MSSMFELTSDYQRLLMMLEDAEDADDETMQEVIKDTLELLDGDIEAKADQIAYIIRQLDGDEEMLKKEEQRLRARRESIIRNKQRLKENLMETMRLTGKTKFKTQLNSFGIRKAGGKIPIILDTAPENLPERFQEIKIEADMDAIRGYLENHRDDDIDFPWAHEGQRSEFLSIR